MNNVADDLKHFVLCALPAFLSPKLTEMSLTRSSVKINKESLLGPFLMLATVANPANTWQQPTLFNATHGVLNGQKICQINSPVIQLGVSSDMEQMDCWLLKVKKSRRALRPG